MDRRLSPRQLQLLRMLADGCTDKDIARQLFVAHSTVHRHVSDLRVKLDARNRTHAVALGYQEGLLP